MSSAFSDAQSFTKGRLSDSAPTGVAGLTRNSWRKAKRLDFRLTNTAALPHIRLVRVFFTKTYERVVRNLMSEADRQSMEAAIVADPGAAPVIRGTGGIRKLRWAGSGRGKRGGIRTIYVHHAGPEAVYLLTAYATDTQIPVMFIAVHHSP